MKVRKGSSNEVSVCISTRTHNVDAESVRSCADFVLRKLGIRNSAVSFSLVGKTCMRRLNREYKKHDYDTDVLSFPIEGDFNRSVAGNMRLLGEIVISLDTAVINAKRFATSFTDELNLYVIHGILHLVGYDDISESASSVMTKKQTELLDKYKADNTGVSYGKK